jgi:hypothetical protein
LYDFRTLSPLDFEELVRDLLQAELGIMFESFKPGKDQGIDFFASRVNLSWVDAGASSAAVHLAKTTPG